MTGFADNVYEAVQLIPSGHVANYGTIACMVGQPRSARYVGYALHRNPRPGVIPCHRVVFKDGHLSQGFAFGGPDAQRKLLEDEGVAFLEDGRVDMDACGWMPQAQISGRPSDIDWNLEVGE